MSHTHQKSAKEAFKIKRNKKLNTIHYPGLDPVLEEKNATKMDTVSKIRIGTINLTTF